MGKEKQKKKQQTLEALLGSSGISRTEAPRPMTGGRHQSMPTGTPRPVKSAGKEGRLGTHGRFMPRSGSNSAGSRTVHVSSSDSEDEVDVPSVSRPRRQVKRVLSDSEGSEDPQPSTAKRRRLVRKLDVGNGATSSQDELGSSGGSSQVRGGRGRPRTDKDKQRELLRRRRRGENIEALSSSSSEASDHAMALYDTDPENPALKEFDDDNDDDDDDDDDDGAEDKSGKNTQTGSAAERQQSKPRRQLKAKARASGDEEDSSMDDFIAEDDDDSLIGVPAALGHLDVPLQFTLQAHKPMKAHFQDAVEYLVQRRINPSFNREDPVYLMSWRKLDDEFRGLAISKFSSAAWDPAFYRSLRARPYIDNFPVADSGRGEFELNKCQACNRTGHPASRQIRFTGTPYNQTTLDELESESDDTSEGASESSDDDDRDIDGNPIASEDKEWMVGVVCASNAETAHNLYHWKHSLKDWVEDRLKKMGMLDRNKLEERDRLPPGKRRKVARAIVDQWESDGVVKALYGDFKRVLEDAQTKQTTGRKGRRR